MVIIIADIVLATNEKFILKSLRKKPALTFKLLSYIHMQIYTRSRPSSLCRRLGSNNVLYTLFIRTNRLNVYHFVCFNRYIIGIGRTIISFACCIILIIHGPQKSNDAKIFSKTVRKIKYTM